jgi:hypothetical protein
VRHHGDGVPGAGRGARGHRPQPLARTRSSRCISTTRAGSRLPNILAAIDAGVDRFDASVGGLGGCPYAPGASGNVCTETVVHALELMGYDTGVDLAALLDVSRRVPALVGHDVASPIVKAGGASTCIPNLRRWPRCALPPPGASRDRDCSDAKPCGDVRRAARPLFPRPRTS